jgi:ubiquitin-activating enzyme E1
MTEIDDSLYSRQLYAIGKDAMVSLNSSSVLISGMSGLGVEIAKCTILTGVKSVTLHDSKNIKKKDLSSNYYAKEKDIGKNKAEVVRDKLSSLNPYVDVKIDTDDLSEEHFKNYKVIVICDQLPHSQLGNNRMARKYGTKFILANTIGLFGSVFCDFGDSHVVIDNDGEQVINGVIMEVKDNTVTTVSKHGLFKGDTIEIKIGQDTKIIDTIEKVIDINTFTCSKLNKKYDIDSSCESYNFTQIKNKEEISFNTLEHEISSPDITMIISDDFDRPQLLHDYHIALHMYINEHKRLPRRNVDDVNKLLSLMKIDSEKNRNVIKKLCFTSRGKICPLDSVIGGITAQEIMKAITFKYIPIKQWFYIDFTNILPDDFMESVYTETNNRYDAQTYIFGDDMHKKIKDSDIFVVGAGAIGCELMKNLSMMGIGKVTITDMDIIEKSNLNRQFLFGHQDIKKFKSDAVKDAIFEMNPEIEVISHKNKICDETLNIYNNNFFDKVTCTLTALDNVDARLFVDELSIEHNKPMIDSGTLGTKCNTQVILPSLTTSYGSTRDPPGETIPMCTLKNFPHLIEHCIQYSRSMFEGFFVNAPKNLMRYKNNPEEFKNMTPSELSEIIDDIIFIHENSVVHNKECINFAYNLWHEQFRDQIIHLIEKYPENSVTDEGDKFWSGNKQFPTVGEFSDTLSIDFIESVANLWADVFKFKHVSRKQVIKSIKHLTPPEIKPAKNEIESKEEPKKLPNIEDINYDVNILDFEKDDDTNFHIDFVSSMTNLRAMNYKIPVKNKFEIKGIAGKIIPAMITTTSLVGGLVTLELYKIIMGCNDIEKYSSSFVNLAVSFFGLFEPTPVSYNSVGDLKFSFWDVLEFGDIKLRKIIKSVMKKINKSDIEIGLVTVGKYVLYNNIIHDKKKLENSVSELFLKVSNKDKLPQMMTISLMFDDDDDTDYEPISCNITMETK